MYAVIATGGKQYKVSEGETVRVEKLGVEAGSKFTLIRFFWLAVMMLRLVTQQLTVHQLKLQLLAMARLRKLSFTSTREKPDIIKRMVIDSHLLR